MNFIDSKVVKSGNDVCLAFGNYKIKLPEAKGKVLIDKRYEGKEVILGIRPEDIHAEEIFLNSSQESIVDAHVEVTELLGSEVNLYLLVAGQNAVAKVNARYDANVGDGIKVAFDVNKIHVFDKTTELAVVN